MRKHCIIFLKVWEHYIKPGRPALNALLQCICFSSIHVDGPLDVSQQTWGDVLLKILELRLISLYFTRKMVTR